MRNNRQSNGGQNRAADSAQDPETEQEMPVLGALGQKEKVSDAPDGADTGQPARAVAVEKRADLYAEKEGEKDLRRRDPGYVLRAVRGELVRLPV